ncbi:MAG: triose-phosphate isomerase [Nitrospiraceae bacterium]|nr:triose-phosphate isomerase [Nitrospiraceae bacterium]OQW63011.1 MAG: triose-phosphate isomerase [Nitrospira sp. ST-bin5]
MRIPLIAGNWKMNKTASEAAAFARELVQRNMTSPAIEIVIAPPFTALDSVRHSLGSESSIGLAGQNLHWEDHGAFTGEVSAPMLKDLGCQYVILGHSERRALFDEGDDVIRKKLAAAFRHGLKPILCVGESLSQREARRTTEVITGQLKGSLEGFEAAQLAALTIAYEPVWAIGTGKAASPEQAIPVHQTIRRLLQQEWSSAIAQGTRVLYGGSVTPQNVSDFLASEEIDGALVGGACLKVESFASIATLAQKRTGH